MAPFFHWLTLFAFWSALSGVFDVQHVAIGLAATAAVALRSRPAQILDSGSGDDSLSDLGTMPWLRLYSYLIWLVGQIIKANLQIARVVLDPRLPIDPALVRVRARVTSDAAITLLANSITATPGTVTVHSPDQGRGEFVIHALVDPDGVAAGVREMEDHVLYALGERGDGA
jgi:multicomponent Na+:H+ antiporter subunit E